MSARMIRRIAWTAVLGLAIALAFAATACAQTKTGGAIIESAPLSSADAAAPAQSLDYWSMVFVFLLATFVGLGVIRRVSRLLYTPLMSLTNAISAIAVVGAILVTGGEEHPLAIRILGAVALFASMTNIVSGFLITNRMLGMFKTNRPSDGGRA